MSGQEVHHSTTDTRVVNTQLIKFSRDRVFDYTFLSNSEVFKPRNLCKIKNRRKNSYTISQVWHCRLYTASSADHEPQHNHTFRSIQFWMDCVQLSTEIISPRTHQLPWPGDYYTMYIANDYYNSLYSTLAEYKQVISSQKQCTQYRSCDTGSTT